MPAKANVHEHDLRRLFRHPLHGVFASRMTTLRALKSLCSIDPVYENIAGLVVVLDD